MAVSVDQKQAVGESEAAGDILAELIDVHGKLDSLWEQYLEVLDEYQKAQSELQKNMSSVCVSDTRRSQTELTSR